MEFREVLQGRRMVRHYREETVAEDVLERAVRMVHRALGAGFA